MKTLIISMTCGEGHNNIAKALKEQFDLNSDDPSDCKIIQLFGYDQKRVENENKTFLWACKNIPYAYDFVWNLLRKLPSTKNSLRLKKAIPYLKQQIDEFQPDVIICTHNYASNILSEMKQKNMLPENVITSTILHDFCLCPYWDQSRGLDFIFQPYENTTDDLLSKGFKKSQIKTFGLPIRQMFASTKKTKRDLGLQDKFTVLLIGGGNGISNNFKLLKEVTKTSSGIQFIVINGKNEKTFNQIQKYIEKNHLTNVINLGYVTNIADYYSACDVTISRCGSSVIAETLSMGKPIIAREGMILNEKITKNLLIKDHVALGMNKLSDAAPLINKLATDKKTYSSMQHNAMALARPNACQKIYEFLVKKFKKIK